MAHRLGFGGVLSGGVEKGRGLSPSEEKIVEKP